MDWTSVLKTSIIYFIFKLWCCDATGINSELSKSCIFPISTSAHLDILNKWSPWRVTTNRNGVILHYEISPCSPLRTNSSDPCNGVAVCLTNGTERVPLASQSDGLGVPVLYRGAEAWFSISGPRCDQGPFPLVGQTMSRKVTFIMKCSPHLEQPSVLYESSCHFMFSWNSPVFCKENKESEVTSEVPCSMYDTSGRFYDLQPLIKKIGAHSVETQNKDNELFINVCANIKPDGDTSGCPTGVAACWKNNDKYFGVGGLRRSLERKNDQLTLTYEISESQGIIGCQQPPKTIIKFVCPATGEPRPPRLILMSECLFEVYWETEFACPQSILNGNPSACTFQKEQHGIDIDLSSLKRNSKSPYNVSAVINGTARNFILNICGGIGEGSCGEKRWKSNSACLLDPQNNESKVIGVLKSAELKYAENELSLTYTSGSTVCEGHSNDSLVQTIVKFICNRTIGQTSDLQFVGQDDCTYIFEFHTELACVEKRQVECSLQSGPLKISLDPRNHDWIAVDGDRTRGASREIHLNFCDDIGRFGAQSKCPSDSAICMIENGTVLSLGQKDLTGMGYDQSNGSHVYQISFSNGSLCSNGTGRRSHLTLVCSLDSYTSSPVLVSQSDCLYNFEWRTPKACPIEPLEFEDCKFIGKQNGRVLDLNILKSRSYYKIETEAYDFLINVCGPVVGTACDRQGMTQARGCQVEKKKDKARGWSLGQNTVAFAFHDGEMINMTYTNGTPYNNPTKTPRSMSIVFLCDANKGRGVPEFIGEKDRAYGFLWRTSLVCSEEHFSHPCSVYDPKNNLQYDLSSLTRKSGENWLIVNPKNTKQKIHLNVCAALNGQSRNCASDASICLETQDKEHSEKQYTDLGKSIDSPVIGGGGRLELHYTFGEKCISYGRETNYSAVVNFVCSRNTVAQEDENPKFLNVVGGGCIYQFLWSTKAACPTGKVEFHNCIFTDPATSVTYNLNALVKKSGFYDIRTPSGRRFQLNICEPVSDSGCQNSFPLQRHPSIAACELNSTGSTKEILGYFDTNIISLADPGHARMTFVGQERDGRKPKLDVLLECDQNADEPLMEFLHEDLEGRFFFLARTKSICPPTGPTCDLVLDREGNEYDLSLLDRETWRGWDSTYGSYSLRFCSSLTDNTTSICQDAGGCLVNHDGSKSSLGRMLDLPRALGYGTIVFTLDDGSPCPAGFNYSAIVTLTCSNRQGNVALISETVECQLMFNMETPLACPLEIHEENDCTYFDPVSRFEINLNPLRSETTDYYLNNSVGSLQINFCGPLVNPVQDCIGSAICLNNNNSNPNGISLGKPSLVVSKKEKSVYTLTYDNGSSLGCPIKSNRKTTIAFICSDEPMTIQNLQSNECDYTLYIRTNQACLPQAPLTCHALDFEGKFYNLSGLTGSNYYIRDPENPSLVYVIRICLPLVHTFLDKDCDRNSASCLIERSGVSSESVKYTNLGRASSPEFVNDTLTLRYSNGDLCPGTKKYFQETVIRLLCDEEAEASDPEFLYAKDCSHIFIWYTKHACPQTIDTTEKISGNCSVTDPHSGHVFNLSSLTGQGAFTINTTLDHTFSLIICASLTDSPCNSTSGACQIEMNGAKRHFSGGIGNANLHVNQGMLYLNYSDGTPCHSKKFTRNTIIQFVCDPTEGKESSSGEMIFIRESYDCSYLFQYHTALACMPRNIPTTYETALENHKKQKELSCVVSTNKGVFDLSILSSKGNGHYFVFHNDLQGIYLLTICKKLSWLVAFPKDASAGCYQCFGNNATQSLGRYGSSPYVDSEGRIAIDYSDGSTCPFDDTKLVSSQIFFHCNPNKMGDVEALGFIGDRCTFAFAFETSVVCPPVVKTCGVGDKDVGFHFDLSNMQNTVFKVSWSRDQYFLLSMCGTVPTEGGCSNSSVCLVNGDIKTSYGAIEKSSLFHNGAHMTYSFTTNTACTTNEHENLGAEILFHCVPSAGIGKPMLYKNLGCKAIFIWSTAEACLENEQPVCTFWTDQNQLYDIRFLNSISHNWHTEDKDGNIYYMNLCRSLHQSSLLQSNITCPGHSAICISDKNNENIFSLGSVQTQRLHLDVVTNELVMSYSGGDSTPCMNLSEQSSSEIRLSCGTTIGQPRFVTREGCLFRFQWKTHFACPDKNERLVLENNGKLVDLGLQGTGFYLNFSSVLSSSFVVDEEGSRLENYSYVFDLGRGVSNSSNISDPRCQEAAVCQVKPDGSFYRDIGSLSSRTFFVRGTELQLVLTSNGRKCGKNKFKNVTTIVNFVCSSAAGLGAPKFLYESGDCDYVFEWDTSSACLNSSLYGKRGISGFTGFHANGSDASSSTGLSTAAIVAVTLSVLFVLLLVGFLSKKERRSAARSKAKSCFRRVRLPNYRYVQCYFLRLGSENDSQLLNSEGETVLLGQDDLIAKDDSDTDPIA